MTDVVIERLRIACLSATAESAEALRMRRRLESIARLHLPRALERSIPSADVVGVVGAVDVTLDVDPRDYDDVTLAILWADRIRQRLLAVRTRSTGDVAPQPGAKTNGDAVAGQSLVALVRESDVETVALRALAGDRLALEYLAAASARPERTAALLDALPGSLRPLIAALLERFEVETAPADRPPRTAAMGTKREPDVGGGAHADDMCVGRGQGDTSASAAEQPSEVSWSSRDADAATRPGAAARHRHSETEHVTYAGGLAFLWPWLGGFLERATALHVQFDAVAARRLALARLVPDLESADGDGLVRFLAGDELETEATALAPLHHHIDVDEAVADVMRVFAAMLPGFEQSSVEYLRREILMRAGVLDLGMEPARLALAPMPLDPALAFLPYPIGLVRLPWARTLTIDIGGRR